MTEHRSSVATDPIRTCGCTWRSENGLVVLNAACGAGIAVGFEPRALPASARRGRAHVVANIVRLHFAWSSKRWIVCCLRAREKWQTNQLLRFTFREHVRVSEDCRPYAQQINSSD
jgi:hypothetical protein